MDVINTEKKSMFDGLFSNKKFLGITFVVVLLIIISIIYYNTMEDDFIELIDEKKEENKDESEKKDVVKENLTDSPHSNIDDDISLLKESGNLITVDTIEPVNLSYSEDIKNKYLGNKLKEGQRDFVKSQKRGMPGSRSSASLRQVRTDRQDINPWYRRPIQYKLNGKSFLNPGARVLPSEFDSQFSNETYPRYA